MSVLYYGKDQERYNNLKMENISTKTREQGTVITGTLSIGDEKSIMWLKGSGVSIQSRGCVPTSEYYTKGGLTAEQCEWDPSVKGGHSVGLTVSRSSQLGKYVGEVEKAVAHLCFKHGILKGYSEVQCLGFVKSALREYERILTFTVGVDPYTVVSNTDMSSTRHPINSWSDNPLTPGYGVVGMMVQPSFFSVVGGVKGKEPVISVHFKVARLDVERRLTPEERLESIVRNPEQSEWASVVNAALTWDPSDEEGGAEIGTVIPASPPRNQSIRSMPVVGGIKKKHAEAKKRKIPADVAQFLDVEAVEDSDY